MERKKWKNVLQTMTALLLCVSLLCSAVPLQEVSAQTNNVPAASAEQQTALNDSGEGPVTYSSIHGYSDKLLLDTGGNVVQANGGAIYQIKENNQTTYYWYGGDARKKQGTDNATISSSYNPSSAIHLYSSTDMYNWKKEGDLFDGAGFNGAPERVRILYDAENEQYVMWARWERDVNNETNKQCIATSKSITGPFTKKNVPCLDNEKAFATLYQEGNGDAYVVYQVHQASGTSADGNLYIAKLNEDYTGIDSSEDMTRKIRFNLSYNESVNISSGCDLFKYNGKYYLIDMNSNGMYGCSATADFLFGKWTYHGGLQFKTDGSTHTDSVAATYSGISILKVDRGNAGVTYIGIADGQTGTDAVHGTLDPGTTQRYIWQPLMFSDSGVIPVVAYDWKLSDIDAIQEEDTANMGPVHYKSILGVRDEELLDMDGNEVKAYGGEVYQFTENGEYYLIGRDKLNAMESETSNVCLYSSSDLYNWTNNKTNILSITSDRLEYLKVLYNKNPTDSANKYVMWTVIAQQQQGGSGTSPVRTVKTYTSSSIDGQFANEKVVLSNITGDITVYQDDDGKAYMIYEKNNNSEGSYPGAPQTKGLYTVKLIADNTDIKDSEEALTYAEGSSGFGSNSNISAKGSIFKMDGKYYYLNHSPSSPPSECMVADQGSEPDRNPLAGPWTKIAMESENLSGSGGSGTVSSSLSECSTVMKVKQGNETTYIWMRGVGGGTLSSQQNYRYVWIPLELKNESNISKLVYKQLANWKLKGSATPPVAVTAVKLTENSKELTVGGTYNIQATVEPSNATNKGLTYTSDNEAVATVSTSGTVTAIAAGTAKVTVASQADSTKKAELTVTVTAAAQQPVAVTAVKLTENSKELTVGETYNIQATVEPANATNKGLTYTSDKTSIATVSESGTVTAVAAGTAKVTVASQADSTKKAELTVTVTAAAQQPVAVTAVKLTENSKELTVGETYNIQATVEPSNATNKGLTYTSDKTSIATVSESGTVTAVAAGTAKVTVASQADPTKKAELTVTVKAAAQQKNDSIPGLADRPLLDMTGTEVQSNGGEVMQITENGETKWYWYGEGWPVAPSYDPTNVNQSGSDGKMYLYSSTDLYNWKYECDMFGGEKTFPTAHPKMLYRKTDQTYVMWVPEYRTAGATTGTTCILTSKSIKGPFKLTKTINSVTGFMTMYKGEDGEAYVIHGRNGATSGTGNVTISKLTDDYMGIASSQAIKTSGGELLNAEGAMFKQNGKYYYLPGTTMTVRQYAVTDDPFGTWTVKNLSFLDKDGQIMATPMLNPNHCVFKVKKGNGAIYISITEKTIPAQSPGASAGTSQYRYAWLPIRFTEDGIAMSGLSNWKLDDITPVEEQQEEKPVTSVTLKDNSKTLKVGDTYQIEASVLPEDASDKSLSYTSDTPSVAEVSQSGLVTVKAAGKAKVTVASNADPAKKAVLEITVETTKTNDSIPGLANRTVFDIAGNEVQGNGGEVMQVTENGETKWYWYGEGFGSLTGSYVPGTTTPGTTSGTTGILYLYSSTDLYNWKYEGNMFKGTPGLPTAHPKVLYRKADQTYVMWVPTEYETRGTTCILTSKSIKGPFKLEKNITSVTGFTTMYKGEDGEAYVIYDSPIGENKAPKLTVAKLTDDYMGIVKSQAVQFDGSGELREEGAMFKYGGKYYILDAGEKRYAVADDPFGVWTVKKLPFFNKDETLMSKEPELHPNHCVFKVNKENGGAIYVSITEQGKENLPGGTPELDQTSYRYVWLPIQFTDDGIALSGLSNWKLDDITPVKDPSEEKPVTSVTLKENSKTLKVGEAYQIEASVLPEDASDKSLTYVSDTPSVAEVSKDGKVTAKAKGTAKVTVSSSNGKTAVLAVTVASADPQTPVAVASVTLTEYEKTIKVGEIYTIQASVLPENATDKSLSYASDAPSVAEVSKDGKVTAKAKGTAKVTVSSSNGKTAVLAVTVVPVEMKQKYDSIPGLADRALLDTKGYEVQGNGGEVMQVTENGVTKWYWYGEGWGSLTGDYIPGITPGVNPGTYPGTTTSASTGRMYLYSSTDLYNWEYEGDMFEGSSNLPTAHPKVLYRKSDQTYVMWIPTAYSTSGTTCILTSKSIKGPFKLVKNITSVTGFTTMYKGEDGEAYVIYDSPTGTNGAPRLTIAKLTDDYMGIVKSQPVQFNDSGELREEGAMFKYGGKYYILDAGEKRYAVADDPFGAWTVKKLPFFNKDGTLMSKDPELHPNHCVFKVNRENGGVIYVSITEQDKANLPAGTSGMDDTKYRFVWLPIQFTDDGIALSGLSNWKLEDITPVKESPEEEPPVVEVTSVTLKENSKTLKIGETYQIEANVLPEDASDKSLSYVSDTPSVAEVSPSGLVTAKAAGTAKVTVSSSNGKTAELQVTVEAPPVEVEEVLLDEDSISMEVGELYQIDATVLPENAEDKSLIYTSSNPDIVFVAEDGEVEAKKPGTATITVSSVNGKTAELKVTVAPKEIAVKKVLVSTDKMTVGLGEKVELPAAVYPKDATNPKLKYIASNNSVKVNSEGRITALRIGSCKITIKSVNNKKATVTVTVKKKPGKISLNAKSKTLKVGKTFQIKAKLPSGTASYDIAYSSSKKSVAIVSQEGKIKALRKGSAVITAKTYNGKKATVKITVK